MRNLIHADTRQKVAMFLYHLFGYAVRITIKYHAIALHEEDQTVEVMIPRLQGMCENNDHTEEELVGDAIELGNRRR